AAPHPHPAKQPPARGPPLSALPKARQWIDDLAHGRAASFAVIARREGKAERHIRLLAPLAFVSPPIVSALLEGTAPADLTLIKLARALPYSWAEQERRVGTSASSAAHRHHFSAREQPIAQPVDLCSPGTVQGG